VKFLQEKMASGKKALQQISLISGGAD